MATKRKERAVKAITGKGKVVLMSKAEEKKWRNSLKTVVRNEQLEKATR